MNQFSNQVASAPAMDVGLRNFMLGTYRYMAMAMGVTAVVAYFTSQFITTNQAAAQFLMGNIFVGIAFIAMVMFGFRAIGKRLASMSTGAVLISLFVFAALLGVFAAPIAIIFSPVAIAKVFFMAVAMFAALSLFGYSTNSNLGTITRYAAAGFLAFIGVSILSYFVPALRPTGVGDIIMNVVGLGLVAVITAGQTQQLKQSYYSVAGMQGMEQKMSAFGAASLLLSFYNIFIFLLQIFGRD